MQIEFLETKDGSKTFSADGIFYHSSYSPVKEANRFIEGSTFLYTPKIIFLFEPGLNYFSSSLKQKFPQSKIVCIRLFDFSFEDESSWDFVIRYESKLSQTLINTFGEESLLSSTLLIWKPAEKFFKTQLESFIQEYKNTLESCKTLLVTRQFFEKKWLLNSCNFIKYTQTLVEPQITTTFPVLVCASGPSLEPCINIIKQNRNKVFILCLSSALSVLIYNSIIPDIILSTDGGYWAGEHLKYLKNNPGIPLAVPCEAFVPKKILHTNPILALRYNDQSSFICTEIFEQAKIKTFEAFRNPTVSGTGLYFAKMLTKNKIFFCGLDLAGAKGMQHSKPNELEKNNELIDSKIHTKETRQTKSRYNAASLQIYRDWFSSLPESETKNIYRIIQKDSQESLGSIKDIQAQDLANILNAERESATQNKIETFTFTKENNKKTFEYIIQMLKTDKWKSQIFPADFISIQNCLDEADKAAAQKRLDKKIEALTEKIRKLADE